MAKQKLSGQKYENNPRQITEKELNFLKETLAELGDLSGVVHDLNSNQYTGGNQRSEVFKDAPFELVETFKEPTPAGTVALGFIYYEGEKFNYRQVRWNEEQCRKAVIAANSAGGSWDKDILANAWDDLPLNDWGVEVSKEWLQEPGSGHEVNGMGEEDLDMTEEFNPLGGATDLHKVIFIFDNETAAKDWAGKAFPDGLDYKKYGGSQGKTWQINLSLTYGQ